MLIYLGPDVLMPIASILGAIGGAILLFWNRVVDLFRALLGRPRSKDEDGDAMVEDGGAMGEDGVDPARMSGKSTPGRSD